MECEPERLLAERRSAPGRGFKANVDGRWQNYAHQCNQILSEAYAAGCPSIRFHVRGHMYKFDFEKLEQKNLNTLDVVEMRPPHDIQRPVRSSLLDIGNLRKPMSQGYKSLQDNVRPQRPVFVVRVPEGGPGTTIRAPHPKKLGKTLAVAVPSEAKVGQALFVPVPRTQIKTKVKYAAGGAATGASAVVAGVAIGNATTGVAAGAGGAVATGLGIAAAGIGGVAVLGAAVAVGAGARYAMRNPRKAAVVGALTVGGLALVHHAGEVGIVEAMGDVAEGVGDAVEYVGEEMADAAVLLDDAGDVAEDGVDFILDLF